jgi:hypothetical protein
MHLRARQRVDRHRPFAMLTKGSVEQVHEASWDRLIPGIGIYARWTDYFDNCDVVCQRAVDDCTDANWSTGRYTDIGEQEPFVP